MSKLYEKLSRRERQIMEIIYKRGESSVTDVMEQLPDKINYSSVRALMGILNDKGVLKYRKKGRAYIYSPVVNRKKASNAALKQVINTFFEGSIESVVAALISMKSNNLSSEELERLSILIDSNHKKDKK